MFIARDDNARFGGKPDFIVFDEKRDYIGTDDYVPNRTLCRASFQ